MMSPILELHLTCIHIHSTVVYICAIIYTYTQYPRSFAGPYSSNAERLQNVHKTSKPKLEAPSRKKNNKTMHPTSKA